MGRPKVPHVDPLDPAEVSGRGISIQGQGLDRILPLQERFGGQRSALQARIAEDVARGQASSIEDIITPSIIEQRQELGRADANLLRQLSPGFAGAQSITQLLQQQAEEELALGGDLSQEDIRAVEQGTFEAGRKLGRGTPFNIGNLAVNRSHLRRQRRAEGRQFAGGAAQLGLQTSNPIQQLLSANRGLVGSPMDALRQSQAVAHSAIPAVNVFDPTTSAFASQQFQTDMGRRQQAQQARQQFFPDLLGGVLGGAGAILGGPAGGALFGKGK